MDTVIVEDSKPVLSSYRVPRSVIRCLQSKMPDSEAVASFRAGRKSPLSGMIRNNADFHEDLAVLSEHSTNPPPWLGLRFVLAAATRCLDNEACVG